MGSNPITPAIWRNYELQNFEKNGGKVGLHHGDCLEVLRSLESGGIDSLVTDPPAGISFMGKEFDTFDSLDNFQDEMRKIFIECLRVLKPGAHGLVWALPKTSHHTAMALEKAGFEVRDVITHIFGTGFPKSHNVSKNIDKVLGCKRKVIGTIHSSGMNKMQIENGQQNYSKLDFDKYDLTPVSDSAKKYDGFGTALKPSSEHWILVRKPLSEKTVAANVLKHGCGGINIDGCRINVSEDDPNHRKATGENGDSPSMFGVGNTKRPATLTQGRFPSNTIFSHNEDCVRVGEKEVKSDSHTTQKRDIGNGLIYSKGGNSGVDFGNKFVNENGRETVDDWKCSETCACKMLDEQSGNRPTSFRKNGSYNNNNNAMFGNAKSERDGIPYSDCGGASRFFYCAKPSTSERNEGLENIKNGHPTIKSIKLMQYLCRLVTPPNGIVLDPFMGSGSTGIAALKEGFDFIGIEKEQDYFEIAKARIKYNKI